MDTNREEPEGLMPLSMPPASTSRPSTDEESSSVNAEPLTEAVAVPPSESITEPLVATTPMPLSMPPGLIVSSPGEQVTEALPPTAATPMPLSMPPVDAVSTPIGDAQGGSVIPPAAGWHYETAAPQDEPPSSRRGKILAAIVVVALLAGGLGAGLGVAFAPSSTVSKPPSPKPPPTTLPVTTIPVPKAESGSVAAIAAAVEPSIVDINTDVAASGPAAGSGIIITPSGEVLTNNHVVRQATTISVVIEKHGTHRAKVIAVDPTKDVALLQIEGLKGTLPFASLGNSSTVKVGDSIVAIGNAYGYGGQPSVVSGTVSATNRTISASEEGSSLSEMLSGLIQITAQIAPGDSGGPLLNPSGQVIGMDTAAATEDGGGGTTIGFAIPINEARQIVLDMQRGSTADGVVLGDSAFLGVEFPEVPNDFGGFLGNSGSGQSVAGVEVGGVVQNSPAAAVGLQQGDVITALGGKKVTSQTELQSLIFAHHPGDQVSITYVDGTGAAHTATVRLSGIPA